MSKKVLPNVFLWLFIGLLITFGTGFMVSTNANMVKNLFGGYLYVILAIVEIGLAVFLSMRINKMKPTTATCIYLLYTFLSGLTFSMIFLTYKIESIIFVFLIAAILFGIFALIGKFTKIDLSKIGIYLLMAFLGILILNIINIFLMNRTLNIITCSIGILVFLGYTAYDIQMIKRMDVGFGTRNVAIYGALSLYIDFVNLFIDLLNLFGDSRR